MSTQPTQIDEARRVMRGQVTRLRVNRRREDAILAEINREVMRARLPWWERARGWLGDVLRGGRAR